MCVADRAGNRCSGFDVRSLGKGKHGRIPKVGISDFSISSSLYVGMLRSGNTNHDTITNTHHHSTTSYFTLTLGYFYRELEWYFLCKMLTCVVPLLPLLLLCSVAAVCTASTCAWLSRYADLSNEYISLLDQMVS